MEPERVPDLIGGRWQVEQLLGEGGMGRVYKAHHAATGARAAVKVIRVSPQDPELRERALQSARAVTVLASPHTVRLLDVGEAQGSLFLVHELVEGQPLDQLIPLNLDDALVVALGVADALADAHRNGFIHRDIKPSNVLIPRRPDWSLDFSSSKLLDFGVAGFLERARGGVSQTQVGQFFGTPLYMSPEQARGERQTVATDVYGLGTLLYAMLVGRPPFAADNIATLLMMIVSQESSFPAEPAIPAAVTDFIQSCLAKDPARRPASAEVARAQIQSLLAGVGVVGSPREAPSPVLHVPARSPMTPPAELRVVELSGVVATAHAGAVVASVSSGGAVANSPFVLPDARPAKIAGTSTRVIAAAVGLSALLGAILLVVRRGSAPVPSPIAAGLGAVAALVVSWGLAWLVHRSIERRRPPLGAALGTLLGRASATVDLSKSLAIDISKLVEACRRLDQQILAKTLALMLGEYDKASASSDRQAALMKAVELMEKLQTRLAPWYVRHQILISWGIGIAGTAAAAAKTVRELLSVAKH